MTRTVWAALALVAATAVPAAAADIYRRQAVPTYAAVPQTAFSWTGVYVGANAGYVWGDVSNSTLEPSGFLGGVTAGANYQWGNIVFGLEGDIAFSGADDAAGTTQFDLDWLGTARGRVGYAWDRFLPYLTGGLAFAKGTLSTPAFKDDNTHTGWTLGAGVESAITQNVSVKIEYLYVDLNAQTYGTLPFKNNFDGNVLRAGVNYRF